MKKGPGVLRKGSAGIEGMRNDGVLRKGSTSLPIEEGGLARLGRKKATVSFFAGLLFFVMGCGDSAAAKGQALQASKVLLKGCSFVLLKGPAEGLWQLD